MKRLTPEARPPHSATLLGLDLTLMEEHVVERYRRVDEVRAH